DDDDVDAAAADAYEEDDASD
ncbi:hypothetical protein A2U01_0115813, partial [Trifolium medium]|nr:hypothetical protein [Trifolium medium]